MVWEKNEVDYATKMEQRRMRSMWDALERPEGTVLAHTAQAAFPLITLTGASDLWNVLGLHKNKQQLRAS